MKRILNIPIAYKFCLLFLIGLNAEVYAQEFEFKFGREVALADLTSKAKNKKEQLIKWINVNTVQNTWKVNKDELENTGQPIGVIRSEKQYENFILHIEWKHLESGGNSGVFVWSDAVPDQKSRLPGGVEVQMLELDWVNLNRTKDGTPPIAYVHGELFGVNGVKTIPDNPRGERSKSLENLCKPKGMWNTYVVTCVDGVIKLSVNGKFVNGISKSSQKKGYLCLESEGAPIHYRNIQIIELPPGITSPTEVAPEI